MVEVRLVGFRMQDVQEIEEIVADALDALGLKASGFVTSDNSWTKRCLDGGAYPHIVVSTDDQADLDKVALQLNGSLGVAVHKVLCQQILYPLPIGGWINRGR